MKVRQCLNPSWQRKVFVSSQWKQKIRSIAIAILKCLSDASKSRIIRKKISWTKFPWFDDEIKVNCGFCVLGFVFLSILHGVLYWHALHYLLLDGLESNCVILLVVSTLELR